MEGKTTKIIDFVNDLNKIKPATAIRLLRFTPEYVKEYLKNHKNIEEVIIIYGN